MGMLEVSGDLFDRDPVGDGGLVSAIGHGCNMVGVMGAGVAKAVAARYPEMLAPWRAACRSGRLQLGDCWLWPAPSGPWVAQLCTQPRPGRCADLDAVVAAVAALLGVAVERRWERVAIPRVGCGIGGLDWAEVGPALRATAELSPVTLVVCTPGT